MFKELLNIGIHSKLDVFQKREIKLLNLIVLIYLSGLLFGLTNYFFLSSQMPFLFLLCSFFLQIVTLILNYKHHYKLATTSFVIILSFTLFYVSQFYDPSVATFVFYFPSVFCIALMMNPTEKINRTVIYFALISISFCCSRFLNIEFLQNKEITINQNKILLEYNIYFCLGLSIALVLLVSRQLNLQFIETSNLLNQVEKDKIIVQNALKEKEVLLVELQHRVKNNLAVIIGLLNMQREKAIQEESKLFMNEIKGRVLSISMVHDKLLGGGSFSEINLSEYVNDLSKEILSGYTSFNSVKLDIEVQNIQMDLSKAVPLGLIINEALTNSFKHAFTKESKNPLVSLKIEKGIEFIKVIITDNGVGFQIPKNENSLGLSLIKALSEQIDAELIINGNKGTSVELKVPYK